MAKDIFHEIVKMALEKEGWLITHDPLHIKLKKRHILEFMNIAIKPSPIGEGRVRSYKKYIHKLYS
jgi:hypothetical protein